LPSHIVSSFRIAATASRIRTLSTQTPSSASHKVKLFLRRFDLVGCD
jgi:hypothetical protein